MCQHAYLLPCREGPEGTMGVSHECDEPSPDNRPTRALCSPEPHWLRVASTTNTFTFFYVFFPSASCLCGPPLTVARSRGLVFLMSLWVVVREPVLNAL